MRSKSVILLYVFILFCTSLPSQDKKDSSGPYGYELVSDVMVPMRDGVKLATDLYFPTKKGKRISGKLPAILVRTPYSKTRGYPENTSAIYFTSHGYVTVYQDTRGRYNSEGIWHMLDDDGVDGYDTGKWMIKQPWCSYLMLTCKKCIK